MRATDALQVGDHRDEKKSKYHVCMQTHGHMQTHAGVWIARHAERVDELVEPDHAQLEATGGSERRESEKRESERRERKRKGARGERERKRERESKDG
jgi:hypothetical protein